MGKTADAVSRSLAVRFLSKDLIGGAEEVAANPVQRSRETF